MSINYYRLKKSVECPGHFYLKGDMKTLKQWEKIFGPLDAEAVQDWFVAVEEEDGELDTGGSESNFR